MFKKLEKKGLNVLIKGMGDLKNSRTSKGKNDNFQDEKYTVWD